jgi:hypothetical protein
MGLETIAICPLTKEVAEVKNLPGMVGCVETTANGD